MATGKERIRRWRERNKEEGRKSVTIIISKKAYYVLSKEKEKTGENYGAIIEKALLNIKRQTPLVESVTSNVPSNVSGNISTNIPMNGIAPASTAAKKTLVDEGDYPTSIAHSGTRNGAIVFDAKESLNQGFLTRLLKKNLFKR